MQQSIYHLTDSEIFAEMSQMNLKTYFIWFNFQKYSICMIVCLCSVGFMYLLADTGHYTTITQPTETMSKSFENKASTQRVPQLIKPLQLDTINNRTGRSKLDGAWVGTSNPIEIYAYSAFYDDRTSLMSLPIVRVIVVTEASDKTPLYCLIQYENKSGVYIVAKRLGMYFYCFFAKTTFIHFK